MTQFIEHTGHIGVYSRAVWCLGGIKLWERKNVKVGKILYDNDEKQYMFKPRSDMTSLRGDTMAQVADYIKRIETLGMPRNR